MLSDQEKQGIEAELENYEHKRAACVEALKIIQRSRGWVQDDGLHDAALALGMTEEELDGVATFYNLIFRRPVGRHVILICNTISCWIMGYNPVREHLSRRLEIEPGETSADGRFTLLPVPCLGACDHGPAMMIGNELYGDLTPGRIDAILEKYGWESD